MAKLTRDEFIASLKEMNLLEIKELVDAMKDVEYFIGKAITENAIKQETEISEIVWLEYEDALNTISHNEVKELFKKLVSTIK